jgi:predicted permease
MGSLLVALNVVLPLVILIGLGYASRALGWVSAGAYAQMNKLIFNLLLPCLLFSNMLDARASEAIDAKLIGYGCGAVAAAFLIGIPVSCLLSRDPRQRGVILQALFRSNFVIYGLPVVHAVYGDQVAATTVMISVVVPLFNTLAVVALSMFRSERVDLPGILWNVLKNPLIVATVLGLACSALQVQFPAVIQESLRSLTVSATPIALIILGGTFEQRSLGRNRRKLLAMAFVKLALFPGAALLGAVLIGIRGVELLTLVSLFGAPAAVSSFSMAQQMGGDAELAAQHVLITTVASIFTIFATITLLDYLGLLI